MNQELEAQDKPDKDARMWGMICHLMGLSGYVIPFGNIIGPLIIWAIKKDEYPFVDDQGKEAMNFQLTLTIVFLACFPLLFILICVPLMLALGIYALVAIVIAAIKANDGIRYRYPYSIKFLK